MRVRRFIVVTDGKPRQTRLEPVGTARTALPLRTRNPRVVTPKRQRKKPQVRAPLIAKSDKGKKKFSAPKMVNKVSENASNIMRTYHLLRLITSFSGRNPTHKAWSSSRESSTPSSGRQITSPGSTPSASAAPPAATMSTTRGARLLDADV